MPKEFDQEATIYIWKNASLLEAITNKHFGHTSVGISGTYFSNKGDGDIKTHVSWWPGSPNKDYAEDKKLEMSDSTREKLEKGVFQPREGQKYNQTRQEWEQSADEKVRLPGLHATGVYFGIGLPDRAVVAQVEEWKPL